jgi:hypothetical protein
VPHRQAGRLVGALFLAAFLFYGIGSALAPAPAGLTLMLLNSADVATIGVLAFLLLRTAARRTALVYLATRIVEALALAVGVLFLANGDTEANNAAYVAAMVALGIGSVPFCLALARQQVTPRWLGLWGAVAYPLLALGVLLEPVVPGAAVALAVPGGLFEVALGALLLVRGWPGSTPVAAPEGAPDAAPLTM